MPLRGCRAAPLRSRRASGRARRSICTCCDRDEARSGAATASRRRAAAARATARSARGAARRRARDHAREARAPGRGRRARRAAVRREAMPPDGAPRGSGPGVRARAIGGEAAVHPRRSSTSRRRTPTASRQGKRTSPSVCTSGSSSTPESLQHAPAALGHHARSRRRCSPSPVFSMKLACLGAKRAPPTVRPLQPAAASSCAGACAPRRAGRRVLERRAERLDALRLGLVAARAHLGERRLDRSGLGRRRARSDARATISPAARVELR